TLSNVGSIDDETLPDITISFTTTYIPYNSLPKDAQERLRNQTDQSSAPTSPLEKFIQTLPHQDNGFSIDYIAASQTFAVQISGTPVEQYKQAARDYFKSQGVNVPDSQINFFVTPAAGGQPGP